MHTDRVREFLDGENILPKPNKLTSCFTPNQTVHI